MAINVLAMVNGNGSNKFKPKKQGDPMTDISFLIYDEAPSTEYQITLRYKGYCWDPDTSTSKFVTVLPNNYVFVTINATLLKLAPGADGNGDGEGEPGGPDDEVTVTVTNQQSKGTTTTTTPIVIVPGTEAEKMPA